jgi:hypothetical protein
VISREYFALWPMAIVMLVMGVASPYWIKAIEGGVSGLADHRSSMATGHHWRVYASNGSFVVPAKPTQSQQEVAR